MTMRGVWIIVCALCVTSMASAQMGEWKNYTSMKDVRAVARQGDTYWASTGGGLFSWTEGNSSYRTYTTAEGLRSVDLTAVAIDHAGDVWTGSSTGVLHVLSPATSAIRIIPTIEDADETDRRINRLVTYGDTLLISTDFGLSVFRISKFEFGDTYKHFGTIPPASKVTVSSALIFDGTIWASISAGAFNAVASASISNPNLVAPSAWTLQQVGPAGSVPGALAVFQNTLYAATTTGLYAYTGGVWVAVPGLSGQSLTGIAASPASLAISTAGFTVFRMDSAGLVSQEGPATPFASSGIILSSAQAPVVSSLGGGLLTLNQGWTSRLPNGPSASQFTSIMVDADGIVWGASGPANGFGLYRFDGTSWQSISRKNSALPIDEVYRVSAGCGGSLWGSTWGGGVVEVPHAALTVDSTHVFGRNVGMVGVSNNLNYIATSNVVCDASGNTWVAIKDAANKNNLAVRGGDGVWRNIPLILRGQKLSTLFDAFVDRALAVDASDNLWVIVRDPAAPSLVCMTNGGSIDSVVTYQLTENNGLPSNEVKTVVADKDNNIWVGTSKGIAIIVAPSTPTAQGAIASYKPLPGLVVNTIAVDPLNQKWVGTTQGVILLSPDGTQQLASYTVESTNGKLIDDDVKSIAIDPKSGTVYIATGSGLASLPSPAAAPLASFEKLSVYPNPFRLPAERPLTVDGLVANSSLKILTTDGRLVRELKTPGGRVGFWDGKDAQGKDVASGIYIVVAYAEGGQVVNGKVAVIKR